MYLINGIAPEWPCLFRCLTGQTHPALEWPNKNIKILFLWKIKNRLGNDNLLFKNYIFNKDNSKRGQNTWRCTNRRCAIVGEVVDDEFRILNGEHNHDNDYDKIKKLKLIEAIKIQHVKIKSVILKLLHNQLWICKQTKYKKFQNLKV
jgi:hypothetical protein